MISQYIAQYVTTWAELQNFLAKQNKTIFAIQKRANKTAKVALFGKYTAEEFASADEQDLLLKSTSSAKLAVIPQSEVLFKFNATKDSEDLSKLNQTLEACTCAEEAILFASRACDARAFEVLDLAYLGGPFADPYYKNKRNALTIITQACLKPKETCFCDLVGSNPCDTTNSDIIFTKVDNKYVLASISQKGEDLLANSGFAKADDEIVNEAHKLQEQAQEAMQVAKLDDETAKKLATRFEDLNFWQKASEACLACGACTFICPTCQCFNITDEGDQYKGSRQRNWDSCMTNSFTREASGHNPRNEIAKRWRNRLNHKFNFFPSTHDNLYACVGCGRCLISCPVNIDIKQMILDAIENVKLDPASEKVTPKETLNVASKATAPKAENKDHNKPTSKKKK